MSGQITLDQSIDSTRFQSAFSLEQAAKYIEKCIHRDSSAPSLAELLNISSQIDSPQASPTASGLVEHDYPSIPNLTMAPTNLPQLKTHNKVPLPPEIMENFNQMQCHCMMGLFTEINRAWLTIDSDIYIWTYEHGSDVAYFDGINETIISVGLIEPKPGVFHTFIKYLLVLTTAVDIVVLGVTFTPGPNGLFEEIQLVPDPVFTIPTDSSTITTIAGTKLGRLFLGSKDGCLFEISYQAESSWFGKRCKKINHSISTLSFLVPSFLNAALNDEDSIVQIVVDNTRNILYTLSEKGCIEVYDMGEKGNSFSKVTKVSQSSLVQQAMNIIRTLDSQNFKPIVSISAVECTESQVINLVAVSQTGVRFYLSTASLSNSNPNQRPYTLTLAHVRLPPGFSAAMTTQPRNVRMSNYRDRNLLLLTSIQERDVIWCLSSDLFPFTSVLMEAYTTLSLDGPALALAEVRHSTHANLKTIQSTPISIVREHSEPPRKFVVLTNQGAHIFIKLRPVDILKQILLDSNGLDSETLKAFFNVLQDDQACAVSLILACLESPQNADIAEHATRAFFMHGGEPKLASLTPCPQSNIFNQTSPAIGTTIFNPNIISTPLGPNQQQQLSQQQQQQQSFSFSQQPNPYQPTSPLQSSLMQPTQFNPNQYIAGSYDINNPFIFSAKHNGLYLYLCRILRPIWNICCVDKVVVDRKKVFLTSSLTSDDCIWILSYLDSLRLFLMKNTQLCLVSSVNITSDPNQTLQHTVTSPQTGFAQNMGRQTFTQQDAQIEERHSLDALKSFVNHCCQVMGLWRILCDHQFHLLVDSLPEAQQQALQRTTFKDLFLYGQDVCANLLNNLVNSYLGDNASVDSISKKLRDICPNLYKNEDAAFSKANEMLKKARTMQSVDAKEELLFQALNICKNVLPKINLHNICQQFTELKCYHAVIDLCVACAKKIDPDNIGEIYYKSNQVNDRDGYNYFTRRMEIYKEVLCMLDVLHASSGFVQNLNSTGREEVQNLNHNFESTNLTCQAINDILSFGDELLHVAVYEWMMNKNMTGEMIKITKPTLETFLMRSAQQNPDSIPVLDVMWKYYESNGNHAAAAKVLNNLASMPGHINLKQRMEFLAKSLMCMRSDKVGYAPYLGVFLRELEDKLEVAKVQDTILDAIKNLRGTHPDAEEAINALNSKLYDITNLYEDFANPFKLYECKLAIIDCAGYADEKLAETIWTNILQQEVNRSTGSGNDKMLQILSKVKALAHFYKYPSHCFPLAHIIGELEIIGAKLNCDYTLVPNLFLSMDFSIELLINTYNGLMSLAHGSRFWCAEENQFHFAKCLAVVMAAFIENKDKYNPAERRRFVELCEDTTSSLLSELYSKQNTEDLINLLRHIQKKLSKV